MERRRAHNAEPVALGGPDDLMMHTLRNDDKFVRGKCFVPRLLRGRVVELQLQFAVENEINLVERLVVMRRCGLDIDRDGYAELVVIASRNDFPDLAAERRMYDNVVR